jgi:hypothetical protein
MAWHGLVWPGMVGCMGHYGETYPLLKAMLLVFFALTHMPGLFDSPETPVENTMTHCVFLSMRVEVTFSRKCQKPSGNTLVGGIPTPLKNMSSSIGIIVHNIWKNVPNHQPV